MQILKAKNEDISELCQLLDILFSQEAEFKPNHDAQKKGLAMVINGNDFGEILVAKDNDIKRITLLTDNDNQAAHHFYEQNGFMRSPMIAYRKRLD